MTSPMTHPYGVPSSTSSPFEVWCFCQCCRPRPRQCQRLCMRGLRCSKFSVSNSALGDQAKLGNPNSRRPRFPCSHSRYITMLKYYMPHCHSFKNTRVILTATQSIDKYNPVDTWPLLDMRLRHEALHDRFFLPILLPCAHSSLSYSVWRPIHLCYLARS